MANLLSGTRIFGTANVDSTLNVAGAISSTVNNTKLTFTPVAGGSNVYFIQQNDDNFVFYSSNTLNQPRAIWNVYGNNNTSNLTISVPTNINSGNLTVSSNTLTLGTSSISPNGYTRLPNGLLMQWGTQTASVNSSTTATATFPIAFPTALYSVSVMVLQAGTAADASVANTANTTAIVWKNSNTGVAASKQMYYTAIGV